VRVESGPSIDLTAFERDPPIGMLQIDELNVGDIQTEFAQGT
jgi:hypothetical protein